MVGISRVMYLPSSRTHKIMKPPSETEFISLREGVSVHQDAAQTIVAAERGNTNAQQAVSAHTVKMY